MEKKFNFVYITTNLINGKQYIGDHSTNNLDCLKSKNYLGSGKYLDRAIKKYGKDNFKREILEQFDTKQQAFDAQEKWINEYNTLSPNGYNISPTGGHKNGRLSEQTKKKISIAHLGIRKSLEHKKHLSESHKGKKLSEETKQKIGKKHKGKKISEVQKQKISNTLLFHEVSENTRIKQSEIKRGKKLSEEHKKKISLKNIGRYHSEESKQKMKNSDYMKNRPPISPETREKMRMAKIGKEAPNKGKKFYINDLGQKKIKMIDTFDERNKLGQIAVQKTLELLIQNNIKCGYIIHPNEWNNVELYGKEWQKLRDIDERLGDIWIGKETYTAEVKNNQCSLQTIEKFEGNVYLIWNPSLLDCLVLYPDSFINVNKQNCGKLSSGENKKKLGKNNIGFSYPQLQKLKHQSFNDFIKTFIE